MEFELGRAILAGIAGTVVMTAAMYMGFLMNMRMDIPMMLGTMVLPRGTAAWVLGAAIHLMMGAIFFVIYALLLNAFGIESGVIGWAAIFGLVHGAVVGAVMGVIPTMHPRMEPAGAGGPASLPAPGFFGSNMGVMGPIAIVALHVLFAAVAAAVYTA
jgi:hypothetical protein